MLWKVIAAEPMDDKLRMTVELRTVATDADPLHTVWVYAPLTATAAEMSALCAASAKDHEVGDKIMADREAACEAAMPVCAAAMKLRGTA